MAAQEFTAYQPSDTLHLWWTADPLQRALIGELSTVRASLAVSLRSAARWRAAGFALSERLPLVDNEFLPSRPYSAVGTVDDAHPDRRGERVIRILDKPRRLSLMELLCFASDERFGVLGGSVSADRHLPRRFGPLPELAQVLRRRGVASASLGRSQTAELFRRMVFNILIDNTDDHEKNHVLRLNDRDEYELSPSFDVLPSGHPAIGGG